MVAPSVGRARSAVVKKLSKRLGIKKSGRSSVVALPGQKDTKSDDVVFLKKKNVVTPERKNKGMGVEQKREKFRSSSAAAADAVAMKGVGEAASDAAAKVLSGSGAEIKVHVANVKASSQQKPKRKRHPKKKRGEKVDKVKAEADSESSDEDGASSEREGQQDGVVELDPLTLQPLDGASRRQSQSKAALAAKLGGDGEGEDKEKGQMNKKGMVYIGHIPVGFEEEEMRSFFEQFGTILHLQLARSKRTGGLKGYGFIQFKSPAVADVVTETMNGYLMLGRALEVSVVPEEKVHEGMIMHSGKKALRPIPYRLMERERLGREEKSERVKMERKESRKRDARRKEKKLSAQRFEYALDWIYDENASPVSL